MMMYLSDDRNSLGVCVVPEYDLPGPNHQSQPNAVFHRMTQPIHKVEHPPLQQIVVLY